MKKIPNKVINLGLVFTGLIIGLSICEMGLRLLGIKGLMKIDNITNPAPESYHQVDPILGWSLQPGATMWWRKEGASFIRINRDGLLDRDHSKTKSDNTLRIAFLGDSFTEAVQVPREATFWSKVERKLNRCSAIKQADKKVEAINFGVHGYSTAQELLTLRQKVWQYQPDMVVLAFFIGNDLIDNSQKIGPAYRPYFIYQNGQLVLDLSFVQSRNGKYEVKSIIDNLPSQLVNNSRLLQVAKKVDMDQKTRAFNTERANMIAKHWKEPTEPEWQEAWHITEGLLTLMAEEVRAKQAKFLVVTIGDPTDVIPDKKNRQELLKTNKIPDLFYASQRIEKLGKKAKFPVLSLTEPFQAYAEKKQVCLHGFPNGEPCGGHWNEEGHRLASQLIAQKLCNDMIAKPGT